MLIVSSVLCFGAGVALASTETCPEPVTTAINKAHPASTVESCKKEVEKGTTLYEVKVTTKQASKLEVDVAPDGEILQTEEKVNLKTVPKAVMDGFTAKYKGAKATGAEKQIKADGSTQYEMSFGAGKQRKEVTFSENGKFLEEE